MSTAAEPAPLNASSGATTAGGSPSKKDPFRSGRTDTLRKIELPEGVEIHVRVAGPLPRSLAWLIDFAILIGLFICINILTGLLSIVLREGAMGIAFIIWFVVLSFYDFTFEVWRGATPGKRAMGLKVVQPSGAPVTWGRSVIRNLLRFADLLPMAYLIGFISCMATRNFQRLGDLAAGTVVAYNDEIYVRRTRPPARVPPLPPPAVLSKEEQLAVVEFADRSGLWSRERTLELADHLEPLTQERGTAGYDRILSMAAWLMESK